MVESSHTLRDLLQAEIADMEHLSTERHELGLEERAGKEEPPIGRALAPCKPTGLPRKSRFARSESKPDGTDSVRSSKPELVEPGERMPKGREVHPVGNRHRDSSEAGGVGGVAKGSPPRPLLREGDQ